MVSAWRAGGAISERVGERGRGERGDGSAAAPERGGERGAGASAHGARSRGSAAAPPRRGRARALALHEDLHAGRAALPRPRRLAARQPPAKAHSGARLETSRAVEGAVFSCCFATSCEKSLSFFKGFVRFCGAALDQGSCGLLVRLPPDAFKSALAEDNRLAPALRRYAKEHANKVPNLLRRVLREEFK